MLSIAVSRSGCRDWVQIFPRHRVTLGHSISVIPASKDCCGSEMEGGKPCMLPVVSCRKERAKSIIDRFCHVDKLHNILELGKIDRAFRKWFFKKHTSLCILTGKKLKSEKEEKMKQIKVYFSFHEQRYCNLKFYAHFGTLSAVPAEVTPPNGLHSLCLSALCRRMIPWPQQLVSVDTLLI